MQTEWDYTSLAASYSNRPDYAAGAIARILKTAGLQAGGKFCDVAAGTGILSRALMANGLSGIAVEPNDEMRIFGMAGTPASDPITWVEAIAEDTKQEYAGFDLVSFGSSFNVVDQMRALSEAARILKPGGWMVCLWNHRQLDAPIQRDIEDIIKANIDGYDYGTRRQDQTDAIQSHGRFGPVAKFEYDVTHRISTAAWLDAWRSHATLQRQCGDKFGHVIAEIEAYLAGLKAETLTVPYTSCAWMAEVTPA